MSFFITPANYSDLPEGERRATVPIYVAAVDSQGNPIPRGWFDQGVVPAAKTLRRLAEFHLGDAWRASELAEHVVHRLAKRHGEDLGQTPWRRVIVWAQWEVRSLKAGNQWLRKNSQAIVSLESLRNAVGPHALKQAIAAENQTLCRIMLDGVEAQLAGKEEYQKAYRMLRFGYTWKDIQAEMGLVDRKRLLAFKKGFYRYIAIAH